MGERSIITEGKNKDEAITEGLKTLGKVIDEVHIEVLEEGKSIMGVTVRKAKVKIVLKSDSFSECEEGTDGIEDIDLIINDIKSGNFEIKFLEDGVYLAVFEGYKGSEVTTEEVINRIERKRIKEYDMNSIKDIVYSKSGEFVKIAQFQKEELIDSEIIIDITKDGMVGYITLLPSLGGQAIDLDMAVTEVGKKIKFGLDVRKLETIIKGKLFNKKVQIAEGIKPQNGTNGFIRYNFDTEKDYTPEVLEDGSVDFRKLNLINNVKINDIIAEKVPATLGNEGTDVTGTKIPQIRGKNIEFKYGKGLSISEDGLKLISNENGSVSIENEKIVIHKIYEVSNNIDNSTGNISFNGMIKIKGSVLTGFEVQADGDVDIDGAVEGAKINSGGSILLRRGIQGYNKGILNAKGNIVAKYIENSSLCAEGDIHAESIMHSEITSKNIIKVEGKKGLIVGGTCRASKEIFAKTIGSAMASSTTLEVGLDPSLKSRYDSLREEVQSIEDNIEKIDKSLKLFIRLAENNSLNDEKKSLMEKSLSIKEILTKKLEEIKMSIVDLEMKIETLSKGKIKVERVIYPGVKIIIGNSVMFIREKLEHCTIYREDGEIKIGPYEM